MTTQAPTTGFQVDDILYSSWGYDQTNATFYKIIKRTAHYVTLLKLEKRPVRSADGYRVLGVEPTDTPQTTHQACEFSDQFRPLAWINEWPHHLSEHRNTEGGLPCFKPVTSRHKINKYGYIRLTSYSSAYPWDGTPEYDTSASGQMGH